MDTLTVSTPGRLCLFGEHQDYLGLPVVSAAISLRLSITGTRTSRPEVVLHLPDLGGTVRFSVDEPVRYVQPHDYIRSAVVVLQRHGFTFSRGIECTITSSIPMKAGTSSSSALSVAWTGFLAFLSDQEAVLEPDELAQYAYEAEVVEFNEAGGMMDQCTSALGGVLAIDFQPEFRIQRFAVELNDFVLGDSRQPKDTQAILRRVRGGVTDIVTTLQKQYPDFALSSLSSDETERYRRDVSPQQFELLKGTVRNYELTKEARSVLSTMPLDHRRLGELLTQHHRILRDVQHISTPKIDRMLEAALDAGAYGGKINGSGGGGCMFVYAPERTEQVAEAIERAGGVAYIVHVDEGCRIEPSSG